MTREIKFRAWVEGKGMFYFTIDELLSSTVHSEGITYSGGDMTYVWDKGEKMQFTGLKDSKQKDLYEGDIIYFEEPEFESEMLACPIVFFEGSFCAKWRNGYIPVWDFIEDFEILGNIYESKHLLDNTDTKV